jgi:hypothetical protein
VDSSAIRRELDWQPPYGVAAGIRENVSACRSNLE